MADNTGTKVISTRGMARAVHETDLCVVGGGLSGLCAAVAAAREGIKVVLMQDRPVLGGNASSEIRVWVRGAKGLHNRETGIISEIEEDNIHRNPELNYSVWDTVLWEKARSEKNIELILNCSCCDAETVMKDGKSRIVSVTGWQTTPSSLRYPGRGGGPAARRTPNTARPSVRSTATAKRWATRYSSRPGRPAAR